MTKDQMTRKCADLSRRMRRDQFAAAALQGLLAAGSSSDGSDLERLSHYAWEIADHLIACDEAWYGADRYTVLATEDGDSPTMVIRRDDGLYGADWGHAFGDDANDLNDLAACDEAWHPEDPVTENNPGDKTCNR